MEDKKPEDDNLLKFERLEPKNADRNGSIRIGLSDNKAIMN